MYYRHHFQSCFLFAYINYNLRLIERFVLNCILCVGIVEIVIVIIIIMVYLYSAYLFCVLVKQL